MMAGDFTNDNADNRRSAPNGFSSAVCKRAVVQRLGGTDYADGTHSAGPGTTVTEWSLTSQSIPATLIDPASTALVVFLA